jgi:fatty-acyl-CoA synthase
VDGQGVANVGDMVAALRHHDRGMTFVTPRGSSHLPFAELRDMADAMGRRLRATGVAPGDRAVLIVIREDEFVPLFFGAVRAGIVPVPINPPFVGQRLDTYIDRVRSVIRASEASAVVTTPAIAAKLGPGAVPLITLDQLTAQAPAGSLSDGDQGEAAFLQFTSGSTAEPKGVVITHDAVLANARAIGAHLEVDGNTDRGVSWLPMYHDMGLVGMVMVPMLAEAAAWYMSPLGFARRPQAWCELMSEVRGTISYAPNFGYEVVGARATADEVARWDLSSWRVAGCAAEPIRAETLRRFAERLAPAGFPPNALLPCYGLAEATMVTTATPLGRGMRTLRIATRPLSESGTVHRADDGGDPATELVSCGPALAGHEVTVVGPDCAPLPEGQEGQIVVRGPSVAGGYFRDAPGTADTFTDGSVLTADLGFLQRGELFVTGREKDLLVLRGRNYHAQDLEWCASQVGGVRSGGVVAFASASDGGPEAGVIVAETDLVDSAGLGREIGTRIRAQFGIKLADVLLVEPGTVPKTSSGKLRRAELRARYVAGALTPTARPEHGVRG